MASNLPSWLTIPEVIDPDNPNGFPIAAICSPTFRLDESPIDNGRKSVKSALTLITAISVNVSIPMIFALYDLPSRNVTITFSALSTTCAFVIMCPFLSKTKPDPTPPSTFYCFVSLYINSYYSWF